MSQRFQIEDLIHQDGMGVIFRALDRVSGQMVVLQRFFPFGVEGGGLQESEQTAFYHTLEQLSDLNHSALQAVIAGGCDPVDGTPFLVTPWLDDGLPSPSMDEGEADQERAVGIIMNALEGRNELVTLMQGNMGSTPEAIVAPIACLKIQPPRSRMKPMACSTIVAKPKFKTTKKRSKIWLVSIIILGISCLAAAIFGSWFFLGLRFPIGFLSRSPTAESVAGFQPMGGVSQSLPKIPQIPAKNAPTKKHEDQAIDWSNRDLLLQKVDKTVTVKGRVQKVMPKGKSKDIFICFSKQDNPAETRGIVQAKNLKNELSEEFLTSLKAKDIRITGKVKFYPTKKGDRPEIQIVNRKSIVIE